MSDISSRTQRAPAQGKITWRSKTTRSPCSSIPRTMEERSPWRSSRGS